MRPIGMVLCLWLMSFSLVAQLMPTRLQELFVMPGESSRMAIFPVGEKGLLVSHQSGGDFGAPEWLHLQKLDTAFRQVWQKNIRIEPGYRPVMTHQAADAFWVLMLQADSERFRVVRLQTDDGLTDVFEGTLISAMVIQHFAVMSNKLYFGGLHRNRPIIMAFSIFDGTMRALPGLYVNYREISRLQVDEARERLYVMVRETRRDCRFSVITYTYDNKPIQTTTIGTAGHYGLDARVWPVNDTTTMVFGTYSDRCSSLAHGLYVGKLAPEHLQQVSYTPFDSLANVFNYLPARARQRRLAHLFRRRQKGKDTDLPYRVLVHDVRQTSGQTPTADPTVLVETYYLHYRNNTPMTPGRYDSRVDGIRYVSALVAHFDTAGQLRWHNTLSLDNTASRVVQEKAQLLPLGSKSLLAYTKENDVKWAVLQASDHIKTIETLTLPVRYPKTERLVSGAETQLKTWYGPHLLAFGYRTISPLRNPMAQRETFYLMRLTYTSEPIPKTTLKTAESGPSARSTVR